MSAQPGPAPTPGPGGITTELDKRTASASGVVDASPAEVFDFIRRPANHAAISGDHSVRDAVTGPDVLGPAAKFRMGVRRGPVKYRMTNRVVEFDEDRVIAWCHFAGHRWRWELEPTDDGRTRATETFDSTTSRVPFVLKLMGLPKGHVANVEQSIANVQKRFES